MAKDDTIKQIWAGIFFFLGLTAVFGAIFFIGFQKGFSQPQIKVAVIFDQVGGLSEGAPVRLAGVNVGIVENIDFLDEDVMGRGIRVTMAILKRFESQVRRSTKVSLQTQGVLGAKYIEIGRDRGARPLDVDRTVLGEPMLDVYDIAEVLESTADSFNQTTKGINVMMVELQYISRKTKRLLDRLEQRVIDGNLFKVF